MTRKILLLMLIIAISLAFAGVAMAQEDDDDDTVDDDDATDDDDAVDDDDDDSETTFEDSYLEFDAPTALEPDLEYEFSFTVFNTAQPVKGMKGEWINAVELTMPSIDYMVNEEALTEPDPIHGSVGEGDYQILGWETNFDPSAAVISWQCFGVVTSANYGDIREGEMLSFNFVATTDADATDGFHWVLTGDMGTQVEGDAFIQQDTPDDDDDDDDDNDVTNGDDDDDSGGGCGC